MNKQVEIEADETVAMTHRNIAAALAAAQSEMSKALKSADNPHFKHKYADLGSVMDACMPSLSKQGIAVIQPTTDDETGRYVETILIYGETGQELKCRVPLIVSKNDMQGYGSAVTYARRYGLMSMAGIAPEDDDGHAATKSPPAQQQAQPKPQPPRLISAEQLQAIQKKASEANVETAQIATKMGIDELHELPAGDFDIVMRKLQKTIDEKRPADNADADEIPYAGAH